MAIEVHVTGRVRLGGLSAFQLAVAEYITFRQGAGYVVPRVLSGISGEMNLVRMVYLYPTASDYETECGRKLSDPQYGSVAMKMPFVEGTLGYEVFVVA